MSNLEELSNLNDSLNEAITPLKENAALLGSETINSSILTIVISTYLPSIAKSLAIIADKMSEEEKED